MIELNYLKDLPVKCTNTNKTYIDVEGATLYIDETSSRYAFVAFKNKYRKPIFAMILFLNEYDINGHLIRKERYYIPHCYIAKGIYITEKPIQLDGSCEGLEVEIALAFYSSKVFVNNTLLNRNRADYAFPRLSDNVPLKAKTNNPFNFPTLETKEDLAEVVEEPDEEVLDEVKEPVLTDKAPEEVVEEVKEDKPVEEVKDELYEIKEEDIEKLVTVSSKAKFDWLRRLVVPAVVLAIALGLFLFVYFSIKVPQDVFRW